MALVAFTWNSVPEMHSCGMQSVTWLCQGLDATAQVTISITDIDVAQEAPISSSTTSAAATASSSSAVTGNTELSANPTQTVAGVSRRTPYRRQSFGDWNGYGGSWLPRINQDLVGDLDPTSQNWTWPSVNVTQGWYVLTANIPSASIQSQSEPFFVANGTSTFPCLAAASPSSTSSTLAPTSISSTAGASATPSSATDTDSSGASSSHSNAGAIAGGVVGGVAFIAAVIAALFFFLCRRKRNLRARSAVGPGVPPKKTKRRGERSESMQALPTKGHGSHSSSLASVAAAGPVSEEGLAMRENYVAGTLPYTPAPPVSRRFSTQSAMGYKPSAPYEGYNMAPLRSTSQPGATRDGPSALTIPPSDEALSGSAPASAARRKPVPKYDVEEFGDADANTSTESGAPSASTDAAHYKRHSFVNMKPMQHIIQPDLPADRQA